MTFGAIIIDHRTKFIEPHIIRHKQFLPDYEILHYDLRRHIRKANEIHIAYNNVVASVEFWEELPFDKVLIFQHDSGLLRTGIEEFFEYDFIGAPLKHIPFPTMNGGFSLRSKEAMIKCINETQYDYEVHGNEDIYFCDQLKKLGGKLPTQEVASKFSVETIYGLGSLGYHAIEKWHTEEQCNIILNQYE